MLTWVVASARQIPTVSLSKQDSDDPLAHIHFTAEGEVTFKSILFVPTSAPRGLFDEYGSKKNDYIKVCL